MLGLAKKWLFGLGLSICLFLALTPAIAWASDDEGDSQIYAIYVAGQQGADKNSNGSTDININNDKQNETADNTQDKYEPVPGYVQGDEQQPENPDLNNENNNLNNNDQNNNQNGDNLNNNNPENNNQNNNQDNNLESNNSGNNSEDNNNQADNQPPAQDFRRWRIVWRFCFGMRPARPIKRRRLRRLIWRCAAVFCPATCRLWRYPAALWCRCA